METDWVSPPRYIKPISGWVPVNFQELWEYRELAYFLTWRDIKVRYKQTILGVAWAVIQPLLLMLIFTLFFGRLVGVPSDGLPYPVFTYAALLVWQLFSKALTDASLSLVTDGRLITKVYFPRLLIPTSAVLSGLVDFFFALIVLLGMMYYYGISPGPAVVFLPVFVLLALLVALGVGYWLAALNAYYRDVRYTLPFLAQIWMFATPVVYPASLIPTEWQILYNLNPMVGVVEGIRWCLLNNGTPPNSLLAVSAIGVAAVFVGGLIYFRRVEHSLADVI